MKNSSYLLTIFLITLIGYSSQLSAQTYKERVRSAELLSQILPPELKITADKVHRASQKDIRAAITTADYLPDYAAALEHMLIPAEVTDWRALIIELTQDCDERIYYSVVYADGEMNIHMFFPPGKKCEKLYLRMVELGLVYPFSESLPSDEYTVCLIKSCLESYSGDCCWNVMCGVPNSKECPPSTCEAGGCEGCKVEQDAGYLGDLFMEE